MSTAEKEKDTKVGLQDDQRGWLNRQLGTDVPWPLTAERGGVDVDLRKLAENLQQYDDARASGTDFEGVVTIEMEENRSLLARFGIPSTADKSNEYAAEREKKEGELKSLRDLIELQKEEIRNATDLQYKVKSGVVTKTKKTKIKKGEWSGLSRAKEDGQAELEYSKEHYKDRTVSGPTPEQAKALNLVMTQLEMLTERLRKNEEVSFSPNELMDEIWTPLVREQIISEDQCPQEFSRILQLWKGASDLYQERCKEKARQEKEAFATARGVLADIDEVLGIGASVANVVLAALGTSADSKKILTLVSKCARAGVQLVSNALAQDLAACSTNVGTILESAIPEPFGKLAKAGFLTACNGGFIAQKFSQRDQDGAFSSLTEAIGCAFTAIGAATDKDIFERVGGHVTKALDSAYRGSKVAALLQQQPVNTKAVLDEISKITRNTVQQAVGEALTEAKHKKELDELEKKMLAEKKSQEEIDKAKEELESQQSEESEGYSNVVEQLDGITGQLTGILEKQGIIVGAIDPNVVNQAALEASAGSTSEQLAESQAIFEKRIAVAFGVGVGADQEESVLIEDLYNIEALIAQIEADRAQLELLNAVLDAVGGVITMVVPQLGGAVKAKQFAMNVVAAVQRSQELVKFTALLSDARKATSPQAHVLIAEVEELERQLTNDVIDAALHLAQAIAVTTAAAAELSGLGAGVAAGATGVNAGLEAMENAKNFVHKKIQDRKVKRAWKDFRAALNNPADRILIMRSFSSNPTLAKYAIAYGAIEMGDPIAKETLRQCGLNDMVLAQEKTNAEKVVRYLEVMFADDITVVGVVSVFVPDSGEPLTLQSWSKNKKAAETADGITKRRPDPTNNIDAGFALAEKSRDAIDALDISEATSFAPWETHAANLGELVKALKAHKPVTTDNKPFEQFQKYLDELAFAAERERQNVLESIKDQEALRQRRITQLRATVEQAEAADKALDTAFKAIGSPKDHTADSMLEFCSKGAGKTMMVELGKCLAEADALAKPIDFLSQAMLLTQKKLAVGKKTAASGDTSTAATMVEDAVRVLSLEVSEARNAIAGEKRAAEEALQQLSP